MKHIEKYMDIKKNGKVKKWNFPKKYWLDILVASKWKHQEKNKNNWEQG